MPLIEQLLPETAVQISALCHITNESNIRQQFLQDSQEFRALTW